MKINEEILLSKKIVLKRLLASVLLLSTPGFADYTDNELAQVFIDEMVANENFDRAELQVLFGQVERKQSIIDAISRPAERTLTWGKYRKIFLKNLHF